MKRYIKSSSEIERLEQLQKAIRQDLRTLGKVNSIDELLQIGFQGINEKTVVDVFKRNHPDQVDDFDAFYEYAFEWLLQQRDWAIDQLAYKSDIGKKAHDVATLIKTTFGSVITSTIDDDNAIYMSVNDPYVESRQDLIQFVDDVKDCIDGEYSGTGRGGSWTAWDLRSDTGVLVKVGIPDSMAKKHVEPDSNIYIEIKL